MKAKNWIWIVVSILIIGSGITIYLVRKKKNEEEPESKPDTHTVPGGNSGNTSNTLNVSPRKLQMGKFPIKANDTSLYVWVMQYGLNKKFNTGLPLTGKYGKMTGETLKKYMPGILDKSGNISSSKDYLAIFLNPVAPDLQSTYGIDKSTINYMYTGAGSTNPRK